MLLAVVIPVLAAGVGYRRLLTLRARAHAAWQPMDAALADRHERVRALLDAVSKARGRDSEPARSLHAALGRALDAQGIPARAAAENELSRLLCDLSSAGDEDSGGHEPPLPARSADLCAMAEEAIRCVRRYNECVMSWNRALHQFPWALIARPCRFRAIEYCVLDEPSSSEPRQGFGASARRGTPLCS